MIQPIMNYRRALTKYHNLPPIVWPIVIYRRQVLFKCHHLTPIIQPIVNYRRALTKYHNLPPVVWPIVIYRRRVLIKYHHLTPMIRTIVNYRRVLTIYHHYPPIVRPIANYRRVLTKCHHFPPSVLFGGENENHRFFELNNVKKKIRKTSFSGGDYEHYRFRRVLDSDVCVCACVQKKSLFSLRVADLFHSRRVIF